MMPGNPAAASVGVAKPRFHGKRGETYSSPVYRKTTRNSTGRNDQQQYAQREYGNVLPPQKRPRMSFVGKRAPILVKEPVTLSSNNADISQFTEQQEVPALSPAETNEVTDEVPANDEAESVLQAEVAAGENETFQAEEVTLVSVPAPVDIVVERVEDAGAVEDNFGEAEQRERETVEMEEFSPPQDAVAAAPTLSAEQVVSGGAGPADSAEDLGGPPQLDPESGPQQPIEQDETVLLLNEAQMAVLRDGQHVNVTYEHAPEGWEERQTERGLLPEDLRTVEFNFLDSRNICCGLCGEIVPYEQLMNDHLPTNHPEILGETADMGLEEIPYEEWLREKLKAEKRTMESGFKISSYVSTSRLQAAKMASANRSQRRVSQIRVNPHEMDLAQLDQALKKKMIEKMGRKVPVTLVDKQHARCGLCNAVVSLNKKFEVVHLVRHFNAWHPSTHRCAGTWAHRPVTRQGCKPLSMHDFAVIDSNTATPDNLQCIWCGMFMDADSLAMHFDEVHPDDIEVPKCNLCLQELVLNARMQEKYGDDFEITLPDEHHIRCGKFASDFLTEAALEKGIERKLARAAEKSSGGQAEEEVEDEDVGLDDVVEESGPEAFLNSRMSLGRRKKPKRQFIMPALRQAAPLDSEYVEPVTECHWKCKMCGGAILAAVISAGAIKHYRIAHPEHLDSMQYELCKARLERVSDGCMEFVHPQLIECLLCNMTYNLHKPFNMCRAIRHLKSKHPSLMPEYAGMDLRPGGFQKGVGQGVAAEPRERPATESMPEVEFRVVESVEQLKQFGIDVSKMETLTAADGEQVYIMMPEGSEFDPEAATELAAMVASQRDAQLMGETEKNVNQDQPGTRVFTLSVGKEGELLEEGEPSSHLDDKPYLHSITDSGHIVVDRGPPMPEPLTTE